MWSAPKQPTKRSEAAAWLTIAALLAAFYALAWMAGMMESP